MNISKRLGGSDFIKDSMVVCAYIFRILQLILPTRPSKGARMMVLFVERKYSHFSLSQLLPLPPGANFVLWHFDKRISIDRMPDRWYKFPLKRRELLLRGFWKLDIFETSTKLLIINYFCLGKFTFEAASFLIFWPCFRGQSKPHFFSGWFWACLFNVVFCHSQIDIDSLVVQFRNIWSLATFGRGY